MSAKIAITTPKTAPAPIMPRTILIRSEWLPFMSALIHAQARA